ncbi:acyltransferase family protein [Leifsonia sp. NPDC056824]|uniref:acyltransferase family protein n=1 Tax=Leifsonia sp. NPDC056824 TaxID=3345953 RepID=UPI0036A90B1B
MDPDTTTLTRAESGRRRSRSSATTRTATAPTVKRLDLQGLRALAVGLVILNHAFEWPAGGFVGVDIFFVISGFLMTSLLYREYERSGTIRFFAFYRRRIRRLVPASATVIVATLVGAYFLFSSGRFLTTVWDGVASLFFVSNWRFAAGQTDYFAQGAQTSPLQHYWSLSLEEQYYLIWPLGVLVLALLVAQNSRPRVTAGLLCLIITAGLFLVSLQLTQAEIGTAYFITPARLWELSVGATVAFCMPFFGRLPTALRPAVMLFSLAGMIAAAVITPSSKGFPAPWALVAVLSTAVFIAFPWQPRISWLNPLDNRILAHLGDISYSLYLWHFPALIVITEVFRGLPGDKTAVPAVVSIAITLLAAELSFRFIEETVRRSRWLEPSGKRRIRASPAKTFALAAASVITVAAVALAFVVDTQSRGGGDTDGATTSASTPRATDLANGEALKSLQTELTAALAEKSWPETDPSIDNIIAKYTRDKDTNACSNQVYPGVDQCTWGNRDAPYSAAIVGDSTSVAYVPLLRALADSSNGQLKVTTLGMYSCPFVDISTAMGIPSFQEACPGRKAQAVDNIIDLKPNVLIITNSYLTESHYPGGRAVTLAEYEKGLDTFLQKISPSVGTIALVAPPIGDKDIRECYSPRTGPQECVSRVDKQWKLRAAAEAKWAQAVSNAVWIDTRDLFCVSGSCPAFSAAIPVKFDRVHLTEEYSRHIAGGMAELLAAKGVSLTGAAGAGDPPAPEKPAEDQAPAAMPARTAPAARNRI